MRHTLHQNLCGLIHVYICLCKPLCSRDDSINNLQPCKSLGNSPTRTPSLAIDLCDGILSSFSVSFLLPGQSLDPMSLTICDFGINFLGDLLIGDFHERRMASPARTYSTLPLPGRTFLHSDPYQHARFARRFPAFPQMILPYRETLALIEELNP
ncbi:hypothetical protein Hanom_Chr09g00763831 [Helianthus anomalus]